jgi:hypothetical protein
MELSIREAKARFAEAAAAAARGEAAIVRRQLGLDGLRVTLPPNFDDPAFSRKVIGLED